MTETTRSKLPIGYWLRRADELITERVNVVQAANEVSRTDWQILNLIHESSDASLAQIIEKLSPFASEIELRGIVARLTGRGWLNGTGGPGDPCFRLTASGDERHKVILAQQQQVRRQAMSGVSGEEYATVVRVLERIVMNLEDPSS